MSPWNTINQPSAHYPPSHPYSHLFQSASPSTPLPSLCPCGATIRDSFVSDETRCLPCRRAYHPFGAIGDGRPPPKTPIIRPQDDDGRPPPPTLMLTPSDDDDSDDDDEDGSDAPSLTFGNSLEDTESDGSDAGSNESVYGSAASSDDGSSDDDSSDNGSSDNGSSDVDSSDDDSSDDDSSDDNLDRSFVMYVNRAASTDGESEGSAGSFDLSGTTIVDSGSRSSSSTLQDETEGNEDSDKDSDKDNDKDSDKDSGKGSTSDSDSDSDITITNNPEGNWAMTPEERIEFDRMMQNIVEMAGRIEGTQRAMQTQNRLADQQRVMDALGIPQVGTTVQVGFEELIEDEEYDASSSSSSSDEDEGELL